MSAAKMREAVLAAFDMLTAKQQEDFVADQLVTLMELRLRLPAIIRFLEQLLAAQGDAADGELVALQHWLAERFPERRGPATPPGI